MSVKGREIGATLWIISKIYDEISSIKIEDMKQEMKYKSNLTYRLL